MKRARMNVSTIYLEEQLSFPPNTKIVGAEWVWDRSEIALYIESEDFTDVPEGCVIPMKIGIVTIKKVEHEIEKTLSFSK